LKADPLFNFAFVNALLRGLPPQLALATEQLVREKGFDTLLLGILQSPAGKQFLYRCISEAVIEVAKNPQKLRETRADVLSHVSIGGRVKPL
jgi:hypothetical protein